MAELDNFPQRAADTAADLTEATRPVERRKRVAAFVKQTALSGANAGGRGARAVVGRGRRGSGWLTEQVVAMAPRLRVRDQETLRAQFPGKSPDEIADALIDGAANAAAAAGGAAGMWAILPVVTAFPVEVAAETLVVVGIEVKLVAELHEAYGLPADGNLAERMRAYLAAWAHRRGVFMIPGGVVFAPGSPLARLLRRRLLSRAGRSTASLGPLLTGAVAGAMLNRSAVRSLGRDIVRDLRRPDAIEGRRLAGRVISLDHHLAKMPGDLSVLYFGQLAVEPGRRVRAEPLGHPGVGAPDRQVEPEHPGRVWRRHRVGHYLVGDHLAVAAERYRA